MGKYILAFLMLLLIIISVIIRLPNLNQPMGKRHETVTAHALTPMVIWSHDSAMKYDFNPVVTFWHEGNKYIPEKSKSVEDNGNYYYTSYPPFAYMFPYAIFRLLHITPDVLSIQIFGMFFQIISACFIYLIVNLLCKKHYIANSKINLTAMIAFCLYLFSQMTLWFQTNVYMGDVFITAFYIIGIYLFLRIILAEDTKNLIWLLVIFSLVNFIMVYTEWLGLFFSFAVGSYSLINIRKRNMRFLLLITILTAFGALLLTVWQYSLINGIDKFIESFIWKYSKRSGFGDSFIGYTYTSFDAWRSIQSHYVDDFIVYIFLIMVLTGIIIYTKLSNKHNIVFPQNKLNKKALFISILPVGIHHIVFFNFTAIHNFSILKTLPFILISIAILYEKVMLVYKGRNGLARFIVNSLVIILLFVSIGQYYYLYSYGFDKDYAMRIKELSQEISHKTDDDEAIFIKSNKRKFIDMIPKYYASRNMTYYISMDECYSILKKLPVNKAKIYTIDENILEIKEIRNIKLK
jgi:hypothetical protein